MVMRDEIGRVIWVEVQEDFYPNIERMTLRIGPWRDYVSSEMCKVIIAEALNHCVCKEGLILLGYLITDRRVCLVLEGDEEEVQRVLFVFYEKVEEHLRKRHHTGIRHIHEQQEEERVPLNALFRKYPLINPNLIRLMLGFPIELNYYDSHVARMEDRIRNYPYCSALDYSGAISPVFLDCPEEKRPRKKATTSK